MSPDERILRVPAKAAGLSASAWLFASSSTVDSISAAGTMRSRKPTSTASAGE